MDFDDFLSGYIECILWSESRNEAGDNYETGGHRLTRGAKAAMERDCRDFWDAQQVDLKLYLKSGRDIAHAGHDFCLTRNRHGAGFWDRGLGELGDRLTAASQAYG